MPTADWNGGEPETKAFTGKATSLGGGRWAARRVRGDGMVQLFGRRYAPAGDVQTMPEPGELLLFFAYGCAGKLTGQVSEWTSPADPDGYIRRQFWREYRRD